MPQNVQYHILLLFISIFFCGPFDINERYPEELKICRGCGCGSAKRRLRFEPMPCLVAKIFWFSEL